MAPSRDQLVLDVLQESGSATVADLADSLEVTEATVRRTLQRLARGGQVIRTYGGATVASGLISTGASAADGSARWKRAIGRAAAELVRDGSTIALSSGSTVLEFARQLRDRRLTVITNALDAAAILVDAPAVRLVVLGGVVLPGMHSTRGHLTEDSMRDLRADTVFMGASAVDLDGSFMTEQVAEIAVDRSMRSMAREVVMLIDSSKFDRVAPGFMFGFDDVGTIVTDERVRDATVETLRALGAKVIVGVEGGAGTER